MSNANYITVEPLDIKELPSIPVKDPLTKRGLFVKWNNVYILDSVANQSNLKIAAIIRRIKEATEDTLDLASTLPIALNIDGVNIGLTEPTLDIYIKCPDTILNEQSEKLLNIISNVLNRNVKIDLHELAANDVFAKAVKAKITEHIIQQKQISKMMQQKQK